MKTLTEIKNTYAQEQGYEDWSQLCRESMSLIYDMELHMNEICIRAQKEALKNAAENAKIEMYLETDWYFVNEESITNENNLIR